MNHQKPIIAGNFKSNLTRSEVLKYAKALENLPTNHASVYIFPTHTALLENHFKHLHIGAQNAFPAINGSFTGEITLSHLQEFHITSLIIGHSERRTLLGESQDFINEKFRFYEKERFTIFYCIGESLAIRKNGKNAVNDYLASQLEGINVDYENLVIAYEPIWAIGTGISAGLEEIESTLTYLCELTPAPLLYGGSVNANNAEEILGLESVGGVLVGSASLEISSFSGIINAALKS